MLRAGALALAAVLAAVAAWAQSYEPSRLDRAFAELQSADPKTAGTALAEIWRQWLVPDDRDQRLLMELGIAQMRRGELTDAEATFTQLIERAPGLPEPWHKRGSVRMMQGELVGAAADFCETLRRERRHFGAYGNLGAVRLQQKDPARALAAFALAYNHNPHMPGMKQQVGRLAVEVVGELPADPLGCGQQTASR